MQCTAKAKSTQVQCQRSAVAGRKVCTVHGGLTPVGPASPHHKTGRYSKYLPARLLEKYEESQRDGELLALHQEINVLDALLAEALQRLDSTDSSQLWTEALKTYRALTVAQRAKDMQAMRTALVELGDILERGAGDRANRDEVVKLVDARKKLVESERKRHVEMRQMISSEEAMTLMRAVAVAVQTHVTDDGARRALSAEIARLLHRPALDG